MTAEATTPTTPPEAEPSPADAGSLSSGIASAHAGSTNTKAQKELGFLLQKDNYVGEVLDPAYDVMRVMIHDHQRGKVGGIPSLSYLLATRLKDGEPIDPDDEHAAFVLLRVLDVAPLADDAERRLIQMQAAQHASGEVHHWEEKGAVDPITKNWLGYSAVEARVMGTFYLRKEGSKLSLEFGSDIDNFYPSMGLDVYKPTNEALAAIINQVSADAKNTSLTFPIGKVRYSSTRRGNPGVDDVIVNIDPNDLRGAKTAHFGITRSGKSNTVKILIKSVFGLRADPQNPVRVGQLVLDPDGEYALPNKQDGGKAIRDIHTAFPGTSPNDVVTYGITPHPKDPNRKLLKLDFYDEALFGMGKTVIDARLDAEGNTSIYLQAFKALALTPPPAGDRGAKVRYDRRVLVYRTLLNAAGYTPDSKMRPRTTGLFNSDLITAMKAGKGRDPMGYTSAADTLSDPAPSWDSLLHAFRTLHQFMHDKQSGYQEFETNYLQGSSSQELWADPDLKTLLDVIARPSGVKLIGLARDIHDPSVKVDYRDQIYEDLTKGRLVIVDQSTGNPELNSAAAERIMATIFHSNFDAFTRNVDPPEIIVYVEEAHNVLPKGSDDDTSNIWVRAAKEGAKCNIGLVYSTQEVTSIQKNILRNTTNWFVGHLNNADEIKEICKVTDFEDFGKSIQRSADKGFTRMRTRSNPYVVSVQIDKFEV